MEKVRLLFLIHDLGSGGAEKVLVNLVNNLDRTKFDITVMSLFKGGVNEQFLNKDIRYITIFNKTFPLNSKIFKLFSPKFLHKRFIKGKYDIEISYLEGPSARIIAGCPDKDTKKVCWIHIEQHTRKVASASFKLYKEASRCYQSYDKVIAVSNYVKQDFLSIFPNIKSIEVLYNTVLSDEILRLSKEDTDIKFNHNYINLIAVGTLKSSKGYNRLINIVKKLLDDKFNIRLYILGKGPEKDNLLKECNKLDISNNVIFLGYDTNPYKYVAKADLFVCASYSEGFSTAVTEGLILGVPVITTRVSGMEELLGSNNEYGVVVDNDEIALHEGIKNLLMKPELFKKYKILSLERGKQFNTRETVNQVEKMLEGLVEVKNG